MRDTTACPPGIKVSNEEMAAAARVLDWVYPPTNAAARASYDQERFAVWPMRCNCGGFIHRRLDDAYDLPTRRGEVEMVVGGVLQDEQARLAHFLL